MITVEKYEQCHKKNLRFAYATNLEPSLVAVQLGFISDLVGNPETGFLMTRLKDGKCTDWHYW